MDLPTIEDVHDAARTLHGKAVRTPIIRSAILDERVGATCLLKAESLQRTGSFKFRGAYNALANIAEAERNRGVVASSSGNHAQGVAEAAALFGVPSTIVMPSDAPEIKKARTRRSGATIVEYDRMTGDREEIAYGIADETGATMIHPFDNFHVIAGQGTCGLEMVECCREQELTPDRALVCTGGGGLLAGVHLALSEHFPNAAIHTVEPVGYDDQAVSHAAGERIAVHGKQPTVCDAIATPLPGERSFAMTKGRLAECQTISDDEALAAVAFAFNELKLILEPGGAAALALLLSGRAHKPGETVLVTLSGGNIDPAMLQRALGA